MSYCANCGMAIMATSRFCAGCGQAVSQPTQRSVLTGGPNSASRSANPDPLTARQREMVVSWFSGRPDRLLLIVTIVELIGMFLPWYSVSLFGISLTINGFASWGWFSFVGLLPILGLLALRLTPHGARVPRRLAGITFLVCGLIEVAGCVLFMVAATDQGLGGVSFGLFVSLVAAVLTVLTAYLGWADTLPFTRQFATKFVAQSPLLTGLCGVEVANAASGFHPAASETPTTPPPTPAHAFVSEPAMGWPTGTERQAPNAGRCSSCEAENPSTHTFCHSCGQALS